MVDMLEKKRSVILPKVEEHGATLRGMGLALTLNIVFTLVNTYLGISLGIGFSFSAVIVLIAYATLKEAHKNEITFVTIASQSYTVWWLISMVIFLRMQQDVSLPFWLVPSQEVLRQGSLLSPTWIFPFLTITFLTMSSIFLSLIMGVIISDKVLEKRDMKFPMFQVTGTTINAIHSSETTDDPQRKGGSQLLFKWLAIGAFLVAIQSILAQFGIPATMIDLTGFFRQYGTAFGISLMLVFVGVGIIISPRTSLTTFGAGLFIYLCVIPIATHLGYLNVPQEAYIPLTGQTIVMSYYNWILFHFLLSAAIGIAIIGPAVPGIAAIFRRDGEEGTEKQNNVNLGFFEFMKVLFKRFWEHKLAAIFFLSLTIATIAFVCTFSIFALPLPMTLALSFLIVAVGFVDTWIMTRMMGEIGLTMGAHRLIFYEIPLASTGVRTWTGYLAYPSVNPWSTGGIIGFHKIARMTGTAKKTILKAYLFRLIPGLSVSILTTAFLWYTIGFPSPEIPGVPLYRNYLILKIFVSGQIKGFVNPLIMLGAGLIAGILGIFTPISIMGISFAMFLPISYIFPIGLGGIIRIVMDKVKGEQWFKETGRILTSGFIAGATISQIVTAIVFILL